MINGVKRGGVDVAWTLIFCFQGVTQEWMSSVFEMSDVFWIAVLSLCSILYDIIVRVEVIVYDVWCAEDDNTGFLSVGVNIFDRLYLKERPISLPMVPMSTIKKYMINEIMWEKLTKIEVCENLMNNRNIVFGLSPPYGKSRKIEKCQIICFDECWKYFFGVPLST